MHKDLLDEEDSAPPAREEVPALKPYSQPFRNWLLDRITLGYFINHFTFTKDSPLYNSPSVISSDIITWLKNTLTSLFPFEGYDSITRQITYQNNQKGPVYKDHTFVWLTLLAFFGLPTRPHAVKAANDTLNPSLTFTDVMINLLGGWKSPAANLSRKQKIVQWIAIFTVKPFIILPLNIFFGLLKLCQNIFKLILILPYRIIIILIGLLDHFLVTTTYKVASSRLGTVPKVIATGLLGILSLISLIEIPFIIVNRTLSAIITPLQSMKSSYATGRSVNLTVVANGLQTAITKLVFAILNFFTKANLKSPSFGEKPPAEEIISDPTADLIANLSAAGSFFITAFAWAFIVPLAIGVIMTFFPAVAPFIVATFGWVTHVPFITAAYGAAQSIIGFTIIPSIIISITPYITVLSTALGLQLSVNLIISAATIAFIAAPVGIGINYAANRFSDWYASWYGPAEKTTIEDVVLKEVSDERTKGDEDNNDFDNPPSPTALHHAQQLEDAHDEADDDEKAAHRALLTASTPPASTQANKGGKDQADEQQFVPPAPK